MKKVTLFLTSLLVTVVCLILILKYIGVMNPVVEKSDSVISSDSSLNNENISTASAADYYSEEESLQLPSYYNCMDNGKISKIRDQGDLGSCWAFAVNAALESRLLPEEEWDFSEDHLLNNNGFAVNAYDGGDYFMALAYLTSWKGPVTEEDDPYNDGQTNTDAKTVKHLQEAILLDNPDRDVIKSFIYEYGAVESAIYMAVDDELYIDETYYNKYNYTYCYNGDEKESNHEVVIIGWDDNYSADNFNNGAYADGAFICMNSWGTEFGDGGIFYVSYCDSRIGKNTEAYTKLENTDNYDNIYQNDDQGWVGRIGFENDTAYFANVYTAGDNELIKAVSFYATDVNTEYSVFVCSNYNSTGDLYISNTPQAEGTLKYTGYYTVDLAQEVPVNSGEKFAVIVKITTPDSQHPVAIEMDSGDGRTREVDIDGKESFISADGRHWSNTQEELQSNVCLKAFTDNQN